MIRAGIELNSEWVRAIGWTLIVSSMFVPSGLLWWRATQPIKESEPKTLRPEMVVLPAGTFLMDSPDDSADLGLNEKQHEVRLNIFAISRTEVTQVQYRAVAGEVSVDNCSEGDGVRAPGEGDELPVVCITWYDALRYANALSMLEGLEPAYFIYGDATTWYNRNTYGYRLPSEAEWEYAARAGTVTCPYQILGTD